MTGPERDRITFIGAPATPLVGRDGDVAAIERLMERPGRLVTLLGAAGVGKTRLAWHIAARRRDAAPEEGVYRVQVRSASSPEELATAVAAAARAPLLAESALPAVDEVGLALAERGPTLLVIDDFDHLVPLAEATVSRWLELAPDLLCLVTSRQALGVAGELRHEVQPLAPIDALELFLARVRAATPGFEVSEPVREVARQIVARLDHLPLAIELAAARSVVLAPEEILGRLDRRLDLLAVDGAHRIGARHSTLRGALEWSWSLLSEPERQALAALAVFEGGFSVAASVAVIGEGEPGALDRLGSLRERSLLVRAAPSDDRPAGESRLDLLQSIRELAAEKLDERGEREVAERRHAGHYLEVGERWAAAARGPEAEDALRHLRLEARNLIAAGCVSLEREPLTSVRLALALGEAMSLSGPDAAQLDLLDRAVEAAPACDPGGALLVRALLQRGDVRAVCGRRAEGAADLAQAAALARDAGDRAIEGNALRLLGVMRRDDGDFAAARAHLERAVELFEVVGDVGSLGRAVGNLGTLYRQQGRPEAARSQYQRARDHHRRMGDRGAEGLALAGLGHLEATAGRPDAAAAHYRDALELVRSVGDRRTEGVIDDRLAMLELERGAAEVALPLCDRARDLLAAVGDRRLEALAAARRGVALAMLGRAAEGEACLEGAGLVLEQVDDTRLSATLRALRACVDLERGAQAAASGDAPAAAKLRESTRRAARALAADEARLAAAPGEIPFVEYLSDARRLLELALARAGGDAGPALAVSEHGAAADQDGDGALEVGPDGAPIRLPSGEQLVLAPLLARLLDALVHHRLAHPGEPITPDALASQLWPGETLDPRVAGNRIYSAVAKIRRRGLEAVVVRQAGGYLLHPAVRCVRTG